jgi:uncharacterized protein with ParB-like and HNH nuclease domain
VYKMRADPTNFLNSLSSKDVTFFIPPYQRNYEWSTSTCKVFLGDIQKVATANSSGTRAEHFFGSVVYVVEDAGFGVPSRYILTDGQQRITTSMLFLMALRDTISDEDLKETIQRNYLENERSGKQTDYKIKLKQVETDWEAYKHLALSQSVPQELKNSAVFQNYEFFRRTLESLPEQERRNLLERGLAKFSIIAIQLEPDKNPWENPQEIFESMNSLGKPLSLADLVRNYLLMGKSSDAQTQLYNQYWLALEKRLPGRLSEFIRDWMQADQHRSHKVARESNFKELYGAFKEIARDRTTEELFEDFVAFSVPYAQASLLERTNERSLNQYLSDLHVIGVAPAYSFIAEALREHHAGRISLEAIEAILKGIRTYLLRRRILRITQGENKFLPVLGSRLSEFQESGNLTEVIFNQLSSVNYALRLPNDTELSTQLRSMNFYNLGESRNYPKLLLSMIEEFLTKSRPTWDDENLQLEHIMPQTLNDAWRDDLGANADEIHQGLVHTPGNITLIRHNQELGNKPFAVKKSTYIGKSGLQVTQNYVTDREKWDGDAIRRRGEYLSGLILENILEIPTSRKLASNWAQESDKPSQFDVREVLSQLAGETIYFSEDPRISAVVVSDAKVLFEGSEWSLSPLTTAIKKRIGKISSNSQFNGSRYWTWNDTRLSDLDL